MSVAHGEDFSQPPSPGLSAKSGLGGGGFGVGQSSISRVGSRAGSEAAMPCMPGLPGGLDLSFGYTPMQFEKINLIGSELSEHAISSLVLSVPQITYLDLRGNKLNAAFGWRLVKAMKKRYLNLEYCNGVPLRALRDNSIDSLNLAGIDGHHGMYGIEVVGAIFLAHFLRLNSSLTNINFRRNHVQKDGAKALAQSLLGNPECTLRSVNTMGNSPYYNLKKKPGIDFSHFRTGQLAVLHLPKRLLDDDDFVFLEEWLRRYDCVTDLDISENNIWRDGVRKLARYVKDTGNLKKLVCVGLPVDLEGSTLIARAVAENKSLVQAGIPLGTCDDHLDRQQMLQHLGVGIVQHPKLMSIATGRHAALEWANLTALRDRTIKEFPPLRSGSWHKGQMTVYMWLMAAAKPELEKLVFGPLGRPTKEYPGCMGAAPELWPPLVGAVKELHRTLVTLSVAFPRGHGAGVIELMRVITRCSALKNLSLLGYASATLRESQLQDWMGVGGAPRWLLDDRVKRVRIHWQALFGLLSQIPHLETFNDIGLGGAGNLRDQPELTCLLLLQCLEGVAAEIENTGGENRVVAKLTAEADVESFCDVLRIINRTPVTVELTFTDKKVEVVKAQQKRLVGPLSGASAGENIPRFTHSIALKNNQVSEALLQQLDCHAQLREFCYENINGILPALFAAICGRERPLPVEKIRVEPKWTQSCQARKRFNDKQRRWLEGIREGLMHSERFQLIDSSSRGEVARDELEAMPPQEFAEVMTGISVEGFDEGSNFPCLVPLRFFPSIRSFLNPEPESEAAFVSLPLTEELASELNLRKLCLCMANLRSCLTKGARPDEWSQSSKVLWQGPRRLIRPGDWNEFDGPFEAEGEDEADAEADDEGIPIRYHWREHLRIGSQDAARAVAQATHPTEPMFAECLLHDCLRSLLAEGKTLTALDMRGNGFTKADAHVLLDLVERNDVLVSLNMIPVTVDEAQTCTELVLDGTGVDLVESKNGGNDGESYNDDEDPEGEAFCREALQAQVCRLDEGDGFIFLSLVTPKYFPELKSITLRRLEIPLDATLAHITDALLGLSSVDQLHLSDLRLSSRGAALLLQAVVEMSPRLVGLNGLPLCHLMQLRDAAEGGSVELSSSIEWNDFPLGCMTRLNLWQHASFPPAGNAAESTDFRLQGQTLTDVGLRGLCTMLRYFAGQERTPAIGSATRGGPTLGSLVRIDLGGNMQISDATVADLCHTLQHPSMGAALRHSLQELSVRSCMRLRSRSAYELLNLVQHIRDVTRDSAATAPLGGSLKMVNGVDLEGLQALGRTTVGGRASGPPMLVRSFVDALDGDGSNPYPFKLQLATLSECDVHFFASVLHLFTHIPYCHVHIVVAPQDEEAHTAAEALIPWGPHGVNDDDGPPAGASMSNDSPFPPPKYSNNAHSNAIQAHLNAAKRFFEACPVSTQLRLSMVPAVLGCEDLLASGDHAVLMAVPGSERPSTMTVNTFNDVKFRLQKRAAKKRRRQQPQGADAAPARPLYVNNINSQRLHCCFRSLYGKDEMELEHTDIVADTRRNCVSLPLQVDVTQAFGVATSVDFQHLDLGPAHLVKLRHIVEMPVLTHVNLNHNRLGDAGVELLFRALVEAQCSVVHVALASNAIGDEGAAYIASSLGGLPRLTSLELCDNCIRESGSIALAEAIGGVTVPPDTTEECEEMTPVGPLAVLSVDLRGNYSRELGARRWAEVICAHPDLKFLCLARNELGLLTKEYFLDLVCAAVASVALSVLDLQDNFPHAVGAAGNTEMGPPPRDIIEELLSDLPAGEFDPTEVSRAVFIRRHRGGGSAPEKKGRQPQQGQASRHGHAQTQPTSANNSPSA